MPMSKLKGCHLNFIRNNQIQLRMASYSGSMDHLPRNANGGDLGVSMILSSSLSGNPRNMQHSYQDAMVIVCK